MPSVVVVLKGLVEFAGLLILGQGLVFVLSFGKHEQNPVYQLMRFLTSPVTRVVRRITPAFVVDRHVPAVALFVLFWIWVVLILMKARLQMPVAG
ncbi:MAG: hypothetical protein EHM83_04180 [Burkholderiales bacterium]|nr:MAG: hypothetical protein EHM83_04180 [Burkholderiales bacterium]